jgi:ADP-ribose pyrophosphatase YjhB (NUDIX family)
MVHGGIRVSVGAVVFRDAAVLLIKRGRPPMIGSWSIPGGGVRHGEALREALRREVMEETGVAIRIGGLIDVFEALPGLYPDPALTRHVVMVDYWAEWVAGEPAPGDDAADARFVELGAALQTVGWDETRRAIVEAAKLRNTVIGSP